ncbi:sensor histidine kinase [Sphingobacterium griseoflavum]|uniref:Signal transduction histidine kinase internal region domain-containing protein n=1 Tax=Sphingobacterium griseoflavum TaxID=1474952 RepID=A0ABQ3I2V5_9SPHI|nr:histidine kinase [Sphingobacterium griseoflavum]GHE44916.1 hypothetical protein GCM10017764_30200 [Sphingobacterium griseoflavum]
MKLNDFKKIEFWIASIVLIIVALILVFDTNKRSDNGEHYEFIVSKITYSYFFNFFLPRVFNIFAVYVCFLCLNFWLIPSITQKKNEWLSYFMIIVLIVGLGIVFAVGRTHSHTYELLRYNSLTQGYNRFFFDAFTKAFLLVLVLAAYSCIKQLIIYLVDRMADEHSLQKQLKMDLGLGIGFWFAGVLFWVSTRSYFQLTVLWTLVVLATLGTVIYAIYYLLPALHQKQKKFSTFFWTIFVISLLLTLPLSVLAIFFFQRDVEAAFILLAFHLPTQLLIGVPLSWFVYKKRSENRFELNTLRTELGKSDANLHFLKSQINPHFLFNALNTLYGTALQEHAERTGEGIQKLGDMMRFMLHENLQETIPLIREVEYLNNYIALQKLRTSPAADIKIESLIEADINDLQIAPMLLIPFVENAFKHGISLQRPSYIKISLQVQANVLYFDVSNSINPKNEHDPEADRSGIGLANVKQRMYLLYKGRHDLIIRENMNEYFVHLTLTL